MRAPLQPVENIIRTDTPEALNPSTQRPGQRQALTDAVQEGFGLAFSVEFVDGRDISSDTLALSKAGRFATHLHHALGDELNRWADRFGPDQQQPMLLASEKRIDVVVGEFARTRRRPNAWPTPHNGNVWSTTGAAFSLAIDCQTPFSRGPKVQVALVLRDAGLDAMRRALAGLGGHYVRSAIRNGKLSLHGHLARGTIRVSPAQAVADLEAVLNTTSGFRATEVSLIRSFDEAQCTVARMIEAMAAVDRVRSEMIAMG